MARVPNFALTKLVKVPTILSIVAPTVAELTGGTVKHLTPNLTKNYDLDVDKSDSVSEVGVDDRSKSDSRTIGGYHGMLEFFRDLDPTTKLPTATDCTALISEGEIFYLVRRFGFPSSTAFAAGQQVQVYLFQADYWQFPGGDGMFKAKMELFQLAQFSTVAIVAA
jgi:hypothetical protein